MSIRMQREKKAKAGTSRSASKKKLASELDMIEGPEAFSRFQTVMKSIFSDRGASSRDPDAQTPS